MWDRWDQTVHDDDLSWAVRSHASFSELDCCQKAETKAFWVNLGTFREMVAIFDNYRRLIACVCNFRVDLDDSRFDDDEVL